MTAPPFFSVIINNFNYGRYLKQAIDSVLTQTFQDYELIVVDDHSTDQSLDILKLYQDRLNLIQMPRNSGQIAANNAGITHAKGQYICFLDSDDVFLGSKLAKLYETILANPDADFYQHQYYYGDEALQICSPAYPYYMRSGNLSNLCQKSGMLAYTPTSNHCYKARFLQKIIPIDPFLLNAHADHPPAMLAHLLGAVHSIPRPLTIYRLHGKNVSHATKQAKGADLQSLFKASLNLEKVYFCVNEVLQRIGSPVRADLNKSLSFQRYQYVFGKAHFWRLFFAILKTPAIQGLSAKVEFLQMAMQWRKCVTQNGLSAN